MKKKLVSVLFAVMVLIVSIPKYSFAAESGKVIFINMNRTTIKSMQDIPSLKAELEKRGYMGLMNIRGDKGTDDKRSLASMGAGGRANLASDSYINFKEATKENATIYKSSTGKTPKKINDLSINQSLNENEANGQYGSTLGSLGQTLSDNNFKVAVLGNSDTVENGELKENRNICLIAMDNYGRVADGNIEDINIEDDTMPFGIRADYDKLTKKEFIVKTGFDEKAILLDGEEYKLEPQDIIVSTDNGVGCVAGVMGADSTKIDENTQNIVIEVATFDGPSLRETARRLNLLTDASQHYIKGALNTANSLNILERCANLLEELADAKEVYETVSTTLYIEDKYVSVSTQQVNGLLGTNIQTNEIAEIFNSLKFKYELKEDTFNVKIPTYRNDITMAADLIEEVVRMYGFDNIPSTLPEMSMTIGKRTEIQEKKHMMKVLLKDLGLHETLTYSLTSPSLVHDFNIFHDQEPVKLAMPLGEERSVTRQSIIGSLLQVINYNQSRNMKDVHLYELSTTYSKGVELQNLAIACTGEYHGLSFKQISYKADYYLVKGFVETIFERLGINESRYRLERVESDNQSFHPGRSAYIKVQNEVVGVVGQVHPLMEKKYDVKDVYVVELNLSALLNIKTGKVKYQPIPQYPSVSRDIALVMDESVPANDVCQKIIKSSNKLVKATNIFDVYVGEHVEAGKKSVAINLTFQEQEINEAMEKILKAVEKDFGAVLRG